MASPAQLQAQAAQLEIQIALLTRQIQSANTPAAEQASLIVQRSQLQNDLTIVQQEITAFTQQSDPPDPQVPVPANPQVVESATANTTANPYAAQAAQQNDQVQAAAANPVDPQTFEAGGGGGNQGTITRVTYEPTPVDQATDANLGGIGGNESTITGARGGNPEAAQQAALEQQLKDQAAIQAEFQSPASGDWRVRLRLAPGASYLYMDDNNTLLKPLKASNGVVFPYMPTISTTYNANYDITDLTHSNYRGQFYKSSYVGDINLTGVFTAQDTAEANYLLAVIHFFRSVTKMFYGQDAQRGAPPPLVYLIGLGPYQFNNHPCVVKTFNYSMPNDVDYIRTKPNNYNVNLNGRNAKPNTGPINPISAVINRLKNAALPKGALPKIPAQGLLETQSVYNTDNSTYVPTKCEIQLTLAPVQTRNQVSQQFSLESYANGNLLKGGFW